MDLRLLPYVEADERAALVAHHTMARDGHPGFLLDWDETVPWAQWIERKRRWALGLDLPASHVPSTELKALLDGELIGRVSIRFQLNDDLARRGGHIGYYLLPQYRGFGYGTELLRQSLVIARSRGVDAILIVCRDDNTPSAAVAARCGGVLSELVEIDDGVVIRHYWIR